jgi:hypothetical protein
MSHPRPLILTVLNESHRPRFRISGAGTLPGANRVRGMLSCTETSNENEQIATRISLLYHPLLSPHSAEFTRVSVWQI